MEYRNFSISASKGKLYLKAKQPTEGYEEVTYGTDNKKTYHQYHANARGLPTAFETKEIVHDGRTLKFLELTLTDGEILNKISAPLKNKGGYTDEAKAIISALNGLDMGEIVTFNPSKNKYTTKSGAEKENIQVYINYVNRLGENGKGLSTGFITYSDIPAPIEKVVAGDKTWDFSAATEFYYSKIQEIQTKFQNTDAQPQSTPAPTQKVDQSKSFVVDNSSTELPF